MVMAAVDFAFADWQPLFDEEVNRGLLFHSYKSGLIPSTSAGLGYSCRS